MRRIFMCLAICLLLGSCGEKHQPEDIPQIVVEGWIESDGYPVVMLTTTVSIGEDAKDWTSLKDNILRWAKVSISDGVHEEILTGRMDNSYFPPYIYTTSRMKGESGKTYTLKVEYGGRIVTAQTTIPDPVPLKWIKVMPSNQSSHADIIAGLEDDSSQKDYYKFFVKVMHEDSVYVPSFMGLINDEILKDCVNEIVVHRGVSQIFGSEVTATSFDDDAEVIVKFCTLDEKTYEYWEDYEDIVSLSQNPFFPVTRKIRSNICGGLGYWAGYGSMKYVISIADSLGVK